MPKPQKFTKEQVCKALVKSKGLVFIAAKDLGCMPKTVYNYRDRYQEVRDCIDTQRGEMIDVAEMSLYRKARDGEPWAVQFVLKTIGKDRGYQESQTINLDGQVGVALLPPDMTPEQWAKRAEEMG